jgi:hypothetical protein
MHMRIITSMSSTTLGRAETRTVTIPASPARVLAVLSDARRLPVWAPAFASTITHEHDDIWRVRTDAGERRIAVRTAPTEGVVDFVAADAPQLGLFCRVVPNLSGSELIFSLVFPGGTDPSAIAAQMTVVEQELLAIRGLVEQDQDCASPVHG